MSSGKSNRRVPQCARCRSHNILSSVRGHKRQCKWRDCTCAKCKIVDDKRRVTAVRVAVLRRERKKRTSCNLNFENFQLGASGTWSMMGSAPAGYAAEQFLGNRRMFLPNDTFTNEVFHMPFPAMYPCENEYLALPGAGLPHCDEPKNNGAPKGKHGDITKSLANFQHEYDSLMRQESDDDEHIEEVLPSNEADKQLSRNLAPGFYPNRPQRMFAPPPTSTAFYIGNPSVNAASYQSPVPQQPRFLPMVLNAPLSLPYPITPNHALPYRVGY